MIAVILVDDSPYPRVLGLSSPLRTALTLQQCGVTAVTFVGTGGTQWAHCATHDDRVKLTVSHGHTPDGGSFLVVDGGVIFDRESLQRALVSPCAISLGGDIVLVHRDERTAEVTLVRDGEPELLRDERSRCLRARTERECLVATNELLEGLRKPQDGIISRAINRRLSLAVTRVVASTELRPNVLSLAILLVGLFGAWLASHGDRLGLALGGLLFQSQSVLDGCDGELARVTFRGSKLGEWIDTVGDDITNYAFFGALGVGLWRASGNDLGLWLGAFSVGLGVTCSAIEYRYLLAIGSGDLLKYPLGFGADPEPRKAPETRGLGEFFGKLRPFFKRDFFVFVTMIATFIGYAPAWIALGAFCLGAGFTLAAVVRSEWSRGFALPRREGTPASVKNA